MKVCSLLGTKIKAIRLFLYKNHTDLQQTTHTKACRGVGAVIYNLCFA